MGRIEDYLDATMDRMVGILEEIELFNIEIGRCLDYANEEASYHALHYNKNKGLFLILDPAQNGQTFITQIFYLPNQEHYIFNRLWAFENCKFINASAKNKRSLARIIKNYNPIFSRLDEIVRYAISEAYEIADRL